MRGREGEVRGGGRGGRRSERDEGADRVGGRGRLGAGWGEEGRGRGEKNLEKIGRDGKRWIFLRARSARRSEKEQPKGELRGREGKRPKYLLSTPSGIGETNWEVKIGKFCAKCRFEKGIGAIGERGCTAGGGGGGRRERPTPERPSLINTCSTAVVYIILFQLSNLWTHPWNRQSTDHKIWRQAIKVTVTSTRWQHNRTDPGRRVCSVRSACVQWEDRWCMAVASCKAAKQRKIEINWPSVDCRFGICHIFIGRFSLWTEDKGGGGGGWWCVALSIIDDQDFSLFYKLLIDLP